MASADFSASSFRRCRRPWPFRADGEISRNKTHFFRPAGCGFTTLLRLGLGLRLVLQTCPQVGLVSAFCAYPPNFASDFLHPRPRGRKLVLGYLVPPNWPIGDFHSRPCVMACVQSSRGSCNSPSHTTRRASYGTTRFLPTGDTSGISPISANHLLLMASAACGDTPTRYHPLRLMASSHALRSGKPDFMRNVAMANRLLHRFSR